MFGSRFSLQHPTPCEQQTSSSNSFTPGLGVATSTQLQVLVLSGTGRLCPLLLQHQILIAVRRNNHAHKLGHSAGSDTLDAESDLEGMLTYAKNPPFRPGGVRYVSFQSKSLARALEHGTETEVVPPTYHPHPGTDIQTNILTAD